jgi:hypothetical protein
MGTGSVVSLRFGAPSEAPAQAGEVAVLTLFLQCSWRLDSATAVVCGAWDDNREGGPMLTGLGQLVGEAVVAVGLEEPGLDVELRFSNHLTLRVFCDQVNEVDMDANYSLLLPEKCLVVEPKSLLREELASPTKPIRPGPRRLGR